jgi:hypothetical protein
MHNGVVTLVLIATALSSCIGPASTSAMPGQDSPAVQEGLGTSYWPRYALPFQVGTQSFVGTGVVQRQSALLFRFSIPKNTIRFNIKTCHQDKWWIRPDTSKPFEWRWTPEMFLENVDSCILTASAITDKGEFWGAMVDFITGEELPARLGCNGDKLTGKGVGLCQSARGLIQRICFDEVTVAAGKSDCPQLVSDGGWCYMWSIGAGLCAYQFLNKAKLRYRLTSYGYSDVREARVEGDRW